MPKMMTIGQLILGRYMFVDLISEGGQASVAKATDQQQGTSVVIRQLLASSSDPFYAQELARFQRTAQLRINHPNVVDPTDYGEEDGEWYMVMPYIEGTDLDVYVAARGGRLTVPEAVAIAVGTAEGLCAAHSQGTIHRDVKPRNIRIRPDGAPVILDFGICRRLNEHTITTSSGIIGSLEWMAPEQIFRPGSEDPRSDLYSLGGVLYFMLTSQMPVQGNDAGTVAVSICQYVPPSPMQLNPAIPAHVDQACMRLLAKRPETRFQTAAEFIQAINGVPHSSGQIGFCLMCGMHLLPGSRFCHACGVEICSNQATLLQCLACGTAVGALAVCPGCTRAFSHSDHRFTFRSGALAGSIFRIPEGTYVVGRTELLPRDFHLSRKHFVVTCVNGFVLVHDALSTNKTYVAGHPVEQPIRLVSGQELRVADNVAIYSSN
jgi:hypothetical protein